MTSRNYDIIWDGFGRRRRKDGLGMWPERAIGRDPAFNAAEVAIALKRHPVPDRPAPKRRPVAPAKKMTLREAAALCGISAPAMLKRVERYGFAGAMAMGVRQ